MMRELVPTVKRLADKFVRRGASIQFSVDDLVSVGYAAAWKARRRFDPSRSSWKTYASNRIFGAMLDEMRALDHVPRVTRLRARKTGQGLRKVESIENDFAITRIDSNATRPLDAAATADLWRTLPRLVGHRSAQVLEMYYRRDLTLKQIGKRLGLSESRTCQIHAKAVQKLSWRGKGLIA